MRAGRVERMTTMVDYWLYRWMDEFDVDLEKVPKSGRMALSSPTAMKKLFDLAMDVDLATVGAVPDYSVIAGRTLDVSGPYNCYRFYCMKNRLDRTLSSAWHYFDSIVVAGISEHRLAHRIATVAKDEREEAVIQPLLHYLKFLSYVRAIGADKLLVFRQKPLNLCVSCARETATERGLFAFEDEAAVSRLRDSLKSDAEISIKWSESSKSWKCVVDHDLLPDSFLFSLSAGSESRPNDDDVIDEFMAHGAAALLQDFHQSQRLARPLLQEFRSSLFGDPPNQSLTPESVALTIKLPYLEYVDSASLIAAISDERDSFIDFRAALRTAINEKVQNAGGARPDVVGAQIERDLIEPSLANIERRLNTARRVLAKKSAAGVAVGAAILTVGVLTAMPFIMAAGVTAIASPMLDVKKYYEDRGTIEDSDMYFLWRLSKAASRSHHH